VSPTGDNADANSSATVGGPVLGGGGGTLVDDVAGDAVVETSVLDGVLDVVVARGTSDVVDPPLGATVDAADVDLVAPPASPASDATPCVHAVSATSTATTIAARRVLSRPPATATVQHRTMSAARNSGYSPQWDSSIWRARSTVAVSA
jgi:hypothetical protein